MVTMVLRGIYGAKLILKYFRLQIYTKRYNIVQRKVAFMSKNTLLSIAVFVRDTISFDDNQITTQKVIKQLKKGCNICYYVL